MFAQGSVITSSVSDRLAGWVCNQCQATIPVDKVSRYTLYQLLYDLKNVTIDKKKMFKKKI